MKIKIGKVQEDATAYGNKFWIQIEDNKLTSNSDLKELVGKEVTVIIGPAASIDNLIQEVEIL